MQLKRIGLACAMPSSTAMLKVSPVSDGTQITSAAATCPASFALS